MALTEEIYKFLFSLACKKPVMFSIKNTQTADHNQSQGLQSAHNFSQQILSSNLHKSN